MSEPISEVTVRLSQDHLELEWGMPVDGTMFVFTQKTLQVRLYCQPFPGFSKPTLEDTDLASRQITKGAGLTAALTLFSLLSIGGSIERGETENAFRPGSRSADPNGKFWPVNLDIQRIEIPAESAMCYATLKWGADSDWLNEAFNYWVVFGYEKDNQFIPVHETDIFSHSPDGIEVVPVLSDVEVEEKNRVRRRAATVKVFISYNRDDIRAVQPIIERLNDEFYYDVWIDYDSIPGGSLWKSEIARGIQEAKAVLFMATPAACASRWCRAEIVHALKHNVPVIPIRLSGATKADDLEKIGLDTHNWIDFSTLHADPAWSKLIHDLPEVLPRNKRALDPEFRHLHREYLRSLYTQHDKINLTYLLDKAPRERVVLFDVYVPLFLGYYLWVELKQGKVLDWWILPTGQIGRMWDYPDRTDTVQTAERPKGFPNMPVDSSVLNLIVNRVNDFVQKKWSDRRDDRYEAWRFESEEAPALAKHLVITGDAGSGKSTLLKHLALCMAGDMLLELRDDERADLDSLGFWPHPAYTPIFVELKSLFSEKFSDTAENVTLANFYEYIKETHLTNFAIEDYLPLLIDQMRDGDVMIFLDGLDEVRDADTEARQKQIKDLVYLLRDQFRDCRIVITSRPYAYRTDVWRLEDFGQVDLAPLDPDRLEELATKLFTVVLDPDEVERQASAFKEQIQQVQPELRSSPLFFTLMAAIWLNNVHLPEAERLPVTEGAIYRECVNMLIKRWTRKDFETGESVADRIGLNEQQLRKVLEYLAYNVHRDHGEDDDVIFKGGDITDAVRDLKYKANETELTEQLAERAGIIFEKSNNRFQFAHRSFQEHLAACYLAGNGYPDQIVQHIQESPILWRRVADLLPEEVIRQERDLWQLLKALLPESLPDASDSVEWELLAHAARVLHNHLLDSEHDLLELYQPKMAKAIAKLMEIGALPVVEQAEMGRILSALGDPRSGLSVDEYNIPQFDWVKVPAGPFEMGGDPDAWNAWDSKTVDLKYDYWIASYPVTYAQFEAFVSSDGYTNDAYWTAAGLEWRGETRQPRYWQDEHWHISNHPVVGVTWYEAYAFTKWLTARLQKQGCPIAELRDQTWEIRLLTESEWEKAARYPDGRLYPWGNEFDVARCNVSETGIEQTSAVGLFPNGANLIDGQPVYDLSGNVWEWCLSAWSEEYQFPEDNDSEGANRRVTRGGSWLVASDGARAASRSRYGPYFRGYVQGFRGVCASPIPSSDR